LLNDFFQTWFSDGTVHEQKYYKMGQAIKTHKEFYQNFPGVTTPQQVARVANFENGKLNDKQETFYRNGSKLTLLTYAEGILHGLKEHWNENGELFEKANYYYGSLQGEYFLKKPDGAEVVSQYKDNKLHGLYQVFYPIQNGKKVKSYEAIFVNGLLDGEKTEYNQSGVRVVSTFYHNGLKEGMATTYTNEGKIFREISFHEDQFHGPATEYFPNGKIRKQVFFVNGMKEGDEEIFYENGKKAALNHYLKVEKEGKSQEWNLEGVLIFEGHYRNGKRHGAFNKYYDDGKPRVLQTYENDVLLEKKKLSGSILD
jgi:antitoxin component YwqK of YwqJK toxin-antitoxin module